VTDAPDDERQRLMDIGIGLTLLGVMLNIGLTIGLTSSAPLWLRIPLAFLVPIVFFGVVAFLGRRYRIISRLPWWLVRHGPDPWDTLRRGGEDRERERPSA
jgi:hypothetical protein